MSGGGPHHSSGPSDAPEYVTKCVYLCVCLFVCVYVCVILQKARGRRGLQGSSCYTPPQDPSDQCCSQTPNTKIYTMFGPKKQVSDFSYTPAILHDLHENKLFYMKQAFYMKTSFLQENKVSDFSYTPVAQFAHQNVWDLPGF